MLDLYGVRCARQSTFGHPCQILLGLFEIDPESVLLRLLVLLVVLIHYLGQGCARFVEEIVGEVGKVGFGEECLVINEVF